ncbi:RidA family protein [Paraburkholderia pallida]|nr:RidA family protein [Paraburkholderia pallida]
MNSVNEMAARAERIVAPTVADLPQATWTNGIRIGDELILSGMTAHPKSADPANPLSTYEQTLVVLGKIRALVEAAGGSIASITKLTVYVTDIADKDPVGRARRDFFAELGAYPASTLVAVAGLVFPELTVEIDATARLDFDLRHIRAAQ